MQAHARGRTSTVGAAADWRDGRLGSRRAVRGSERWPASLTLVRHAESIGNVARDLAEARGDAVIDIAERDMDVPLSTRGETQARAVGAWLAEHRKDDVAAVLASPYVRAARTAELLVDAAALPCAPTLDERLREREFGVLDRLTRLGITQKFPDQAEARARVGKFYYRPPGGESWCDVALRVRSVLDSITREHGGGHVVIVTHQVVILMFRYVIERLTERQVLDLGSARDIANTSLTTFVRRRGDETMTLESFNEVVPLTETGAPVTREPDAPVAPR
jgi:2,3-bisphosphoglycerate-dependent phosphoglycerate mutase